MQNGTHPSWSLVTDAPADLNFAMYVACSFNIIPETTPFVREQIWSARRVDVSDKDELRILTEQWLSWWKDIVKDRADNQLQGRWSRYYAQNGEFLALGEPLRGSCEAVFPSFKEWWGLTAGGQQGVNFWDKAEEFRPLVKQVENEVGRAAHPFRLMVDIYTGLGQIVEVTSSYVIMSVHRPELSIGNSEWWLEKVRELA